MTKDEIDLLYVTSPDSFCYYTGYKATWYRAQSTTRLPAQAALVIHVDHDDFIFFETLDEYLVHQATATLENRHWLPCEIAESAEVGANYIVGELQKLGWAKGRVGMELWSHVPSPAISNLIQAAFENAGDTVVDGTLTIRGVRKKKSPQELAYIEEAARIVDIGHKAVADSVRPGITQAELQGNALQAMLAAGGELSGTNQGVISGPFASAHANSLQRPINPGEQFAVDLSGVLHRYHANVARTYIYGDPTKETMAMCEASKGGVELLCEVAKAGTPVSEVARTVWDFYIDAGIWDYRQWVGGYELGIAFPPDWVGEWIFYIEEEDEPGVFEEDTVTNFESVFANIGLGNIAGIGQPTVGVNIDTIIYGKDKTRSLSNIDMLPIIVG